MVTVGFGDILPRNPIEKLFCIIVIIIGCIVYGYSINTIGSILNDIFKNE